MSGSSPVPVTSTMLVVAPPNSLASEAGVAQHGRHARDGRERDVVVLVRVWGSSSHPHPLGKTSRAHAVEYERSLVRRQGGRVALVPAAVVTVTSHLADIVLPG